MNKQYNNGIDDIGPLLIGGFDCPSHQDQQSHPSTSTYIETKQSRETYKDRSHYYIILSKQSKDEAIRQLGRNPTQQDYQRVSKQFKTPIKNLQRWRKDGTERRKGCGRKKQHEYAEDMLVEWIVAQVKEKGRKVSRVELQQKALSLINKQGFRASQGYLDDFIRNRNIKQLMIRTLLEAFNPYETLEESEFEDTRQPFYKFQQYQYDD